MNPRVVSSFCAVATALFLCSIGILHAIVNVTQTGRAIERGHMAPRLAGSVVANAAFSGAAMTMLGVLVFLLLPGLRAGSRQAKRLASAIGVFVGAAGAAAYVWSPTQPQVLIFLFFGALLAAPLVIWRREFSNA